MDGKLANYILEEVTKKNKKIDKDNEKIDKDNERKQKKADKKKNITAEEWLDDIAGNAAKCRWATHVGRFINPDVKTILNVTPVSHANEGYITTAGTDCQVDMSVNAAYLGTAKLLMLPLADGKNVYQHLKEDDQFLQKELPELDIDYEKITKLLLQAVTDALPDATDERLRQVYFPIDVNQAKYHLLTVMPPSSVMIELCQRIRAMEDKSYKVRHNDITDDSYTQLYDLTEIGFGGTKPQNISCGNNGIGGRCYLLNSMPPALAKRKLALPKTDFFKDTLNVQQYYDLFKELHSVYKTKNNNHAIRTHARNIEMAIIDRVLFSAFRLRQLESGWSDSNNCILPVNQKIWLDDKYSAQRLYETDWTEAIAIKFADWIMDSYKIVMKEEKITLGDGEYLALKHAVKDAVSAYTTTEGGMSE